VRLEMTPEWRERIEAAQEIRSYTIGDASYDRIPYGGERGGPFPEPCHDCGVLIGQYHVELICDMEECPRCHGQVIGCDCPYAGDDVGEAAAALEKQRWAEAQPAIAWQDLVGRIAGDIEGFSVFLETRNRRLVPPKQAKGEDVIALAVTWVAEDCPPPKTEEHAHRLLTRLAHRSDLDAFMQLSRDPGSFVGYYIRITG
jgi:hypothetical protein